MKFQTLFLHLFDVYIFKVKIEKPESEKIRGIQGFNLQVGNKYSEKYSHLNGLEAGYVCISVK